MIVSIVLSISNKHFGVQTNGQTKHARPVRRVFVCSLYVAVAAILYVCKRTDQCPLYMFKKNTKMPKIYYVVLFSSNRVQQGKRLRKKRCFSLLR